MVTTGRGPALSFVVHLPNVSVAVASDVFRIRSEAGDGERANGTGTHPTTGEPRASGLAPHQSVDPRQGGGAQSNGGSQDWMAMLDAVLTEMEGEQRAAVRESAAPTKDALQVRGPREDHYKNRAMASIQTDRITAAPPLKERPGISVRTNDAGLGDLLQRNLISAHQAHDRRRSIQPRMA